MTTSRSPDNDRKIHVSDDQALTAGGVNDTDAPDATPSPVDEARPQRRQRPTLLAVLSDLVEQHEKALGNETKAKQVRQMTVIVWVLPMIFIVVTIAAVVLLSMQIDLRPLLNVGKSPLTGLLTGLGVPSAIVTTVLVRRKIKARSEKN